MTYHIHCSYMWPDHSHLQCTMFAWYKQACIQKHRPEWRLLLSQTHVIIFLLSQLCQVPRLDLILLLTVVLWWC